MGLFTRQPVSSEVDQLSAELTDAPAPVESTPSPAQELSSAYQSYLDSQEKDKTSEPTLGPQGEPCDWRRHFDDAFMCYTVTSQWKHYYRYGEQKDCNAKWDEFMWCSKTRMYSKEEQIQMNDERRRERLAKLRAARNSEEVWPLRRVPLADPWNYEAEPKADTDLNA
ncbi:hypothetical protein SAICODRAFT_92289 [Saitoella complicata NRRL Y-17804]|uniref:Early meiotic induction protein 1 n=1 Tax=Saitoella complicata (strain BCRC 22490 / CBS 7301 / JCM 7358 / NBRC 10748 / NRRL Y-17804) TaxID=698492 RepID=A0A0E9N941_SAICN|nr:uncharacterized protein SAICODRAFT_92289 [Saitoella complicata NRRL Y-17804]ODQ53203.1 hypothetical protein SAICODRAFT_92289 [Saitoella complicata NRRL Y-17804]GAO46328.1 hypothetical protein G7K_0560-t1 [Saitoella complicata NRRL Y-17804]